MSDLLDKIVEEIKVKLEEKRPEIADAISEILSLVQKALVSMSVAIEKLEDEINKTPEETTVDSGDAPPSV